MDGLADQCRDLAAWAEGSDPLYAHLCRQAADDPHGAWLSEVATGGSDLDVER